MACQAALKAICHAPGWAQAWFALAAMIMQLVLNTKLVYIARRSTRGGRVNRLERSVFWFGSDGPWSVSAPDCNVSLHDNNMSSASFCHDAVLPSSTAQA